MSMTDIEARNTGDTAATRNRVPIHDLINFGSAGAPVLVSVIVPVCNVEEYLEECLDSIQRQTLEDIEIICVNDGSPDNSIKILRERASRDARIKVVDKENAGYGHTMNIGMDLASGEYIAIVESDDYIRPRMLETLYNTATQHNLDFVKSDFYRFTTEEAATRLFYHALTPNGEQYNKVLHPLDDLLLFRFTNTWTGLYKRSFLLQHNIRHQETPGASYQDNGFWFQTTCAAERIMYLEEPFYMNRRDNPGSSVFSDKKLYAGNAEYSFIERFLSRNPDLQLKYEGRLIKKKLDTYLYNYRRVSPDLKLAYIKACALEFADAFDRDQVDESLFSKSDLKAMRDIATDPIGFDLLNRSSMIAKYSRAIDDDAIQIVFITDDGYALPAGTAITSLIDSKKPGTRYHVTIVADRVSDANIKRFARLARPGTTVEVLYLDGNELGSLHPAALTNYGVPPTALLKFILPSLLDHIDKVLYIDDDVLIRDDLTELFHSDLNGHVAGVVADMPQVLYNQQVFGSRYGRKYFNSGVLLLDLSRMRAEEFEKQLIFTKGSLETNLMDQDVLNEVFGDDVLHLPIRYNTLILNLARSVGRYKIEDINARFSTKYRTVEDIRRDSAIVHFCSKDKPWKYYDVALADEWLASFMRSPFSDVRLWRRSISERDNEVVSNGAVATASEEYAARLAIAVRVDRFSYTTLRLLSDQVHNAKSQAVVIYAFHESLSADDLEKVCDFEHEGVSIVAVNIATLLARDGAYPGNASFSPDYFKLIAPEVLAQHDRVLILDDAGIRGSLDEVADVLGAGAVIAVAPLDGGKVRFFQSGALMVDVPQVIRGRLKQRYLKMRTKGGPGSGPNAAIHSALKGFRVVALGSSAIDVESHNRSISMQDIRDEMVRHRKLATLSLAPFAQAPAAATARPDGSTKVGPTRTYDEGVARVRSSNTYRIGQVFTFLPGLLKKLVKNS